LDIIAWYEKNKDVKTYEKITDNIKEAIEEDSDEDPIDSSFTQSPVSQSNLNLIRKSDTSNSRFEISKPAEEQKTSLIFNTS
jgi:hypothetical protein